MYMHNYALQIPRELWERLRQQCEKGNIAKFVRKAIKEKLDREKKRES